MNNPLFKKILLFSLGIIVVLGAVYVFGFMDKGIENNSQPQIIAPSNPPSTVISDKTPVKITDTQNQVINKFKSDKNSAKTVNASKDPNAVQFKETLNSKGSPIKQTVFQDSNYNYRFFSNGNITIDNKIISSYTEKGNATLDKVKKIALALANKLMTVTSGCKYIVYENKSLKGSPVSNVMYSVIIREYTNKNIFTGSNFVMYINKNGIVCGSIFIKGNAQVAINQSPKLTKTQATDTVISYIKKTYNLKVSTILNSELLVFKDKLAWNVEFYLNKGTYNYKFNIDAINGEILLDGIDLLRKARIPAK